MILPVLSILAGLGLLVLGGELLVRGATALALRAGVQPAVVGLTVVAAGTSMPELVVSLNAAIAGSAELAVGNVVGSNSFNIGAILGLSALLAPLALRGQTVKLEWPVMMLSALLLGLLARDGTLDRVEGGFLLSGLVAFLAYNVRIARSDLTGPEQQQVESTVVAPGLSLARCWMLVLAGCGVLAGGAKLLVDGAVEVARGAGVSESVIGLTVVAAGTSLPELFASLVAALKGRDDIAVTNVVGSNIFNVLGILGTTSLVQPLGIQPQVLRSDLPWMLGFSLVLLPLMRSGMRIQRAEGALLLAGYLVYTALLVAG